MAPRLSDLLDEAVARAIITPAQRDRILHLGGEESSSPPARTGELMAWAREAPRGFNAINVAYGVGALAVVFALGWFLADRWDLLGAGGVLVVALIYAMVFIAAARAFTRERFPTAHGVAICLVIITAPVVVWAALTATGIWPAEPDAACTTLYGPFWLCRSHETVLAAVTFAAALGATRWLSFAPLMIPGAAALAVLLYEIALEVSRGGDIEPVTGWAFTFAASVLAAMAYETDRRRQHEDYARWLHLAAAVCAVVALVDIFNSDLASKHLLLPTAVACMAASLFLRRIVWLAIGLGSLFTYLAWLASSVFRQAVAFPVILALVGITVILLTVWVQRSYPRLAARVRENDGATARFPGGAALLLAPALVAVLVMPATRDERRWERMLQDAEMHRALATPPQRPARRPVAVLARDTTAATDSVVKRDSAAKADSVTRRDSTRRDSTRRDTTRKTDTTTFRIAR